VFQEKLILKNGVDSGIPKVMALDALLGGIDTTGKGTSRNDRRFLSPALNNPIIPYLLCP
jgi:hypothetical protein